MAPFTQVGKYILKRKIGEGAFAEVRLAVHQDTKEEFAVKVFDREALPSVHFERDIKKEIKIMQYLRHPNIVSIHAVLVTERKLYLVMELVRGGELYDEIVSKRRVDERTSRRYFQQIVDAMVYCHRRGVFHRDLKPENLLLDGNGNIKITDFGMSWMKDNFNPAIKAKQLLRTQCGTPKYMAPEIIVRPAEGYDGEKLDAWECGMVLYALLAGYLPFSGEDDNTVFRSILNGKLKYPSHFSPGARDLLSRLLEKDPRKRSTLAEIREHFWFLVNYEGDVLTRNNLVSQSHGPKAREEMRTRNEEYAKAEKENKDPHQPKKDELATFRPSQHLHDGMRTSPVLNRNESEAKGATKTNYGCNPATRDPKEEPARHQRTFAAVDGQEDLKTQHPKSQEPNTVGIQNQFVKIPSRPLHTPRNSRRKTPAPLNPSLFHDQNGSGSATGSPEMINDTNTNIESKPPMLVQRPSRAKVTEPQGNATPSQKAKHIKESPRNARGKIDTDASKRGPRKNPPLAQKLSSIVHTASSGGETMDEEDAPLSFRDRLRSPLATVLRSLKSGAGSTDTDSAVDSVKSSWFETSPSSVADLNRRTSKINRQARISKALSSSDEDCGPSSREATARVEIPMSPSAFKRMTKVFQKKS